VEGKPVWAVGPVIDLPEGQNPEAPGRRDCGVVRSANARIRRVRVVRVGVVYFSGAGDRAGTGSGGERAALPVGAAAAGLKTRRGGSVVGGGVESGAAAGWLRAAAWGAVPYRDRVGTAGGDFGTRSDGGFYYPLRMEFGSGERGGGRSDDCVAAAIGPAGNALLLVREAKVAVEMKMSDGVAKRDEVERAVRRLMAAEEMKRRVKDVE
jgi:hypothetical protein